MLCLELLILLLVVSVDGFAETVTLPQYQIPQHFLYAVPKSPETPPPPQKRIVMYSSNFCNRCESEDTCKPCARAKKTFQEYNLEYEEYNIDASPLNLKQYQKLGGGVLPLLFINGKRMYGFRKGLFEEIYRAAPEKPPS